MHLNKRDPERYGSQDPEFEVRRRNEEIGVRRKNNNIGSSAQPWSGEVEDK